MTPSPRDSGPAAFSTRGTTGFNRHPDWPSLVAELDSLAASAVTADSDRRNLQPHHLAAGFNELVLLRQGGDPDYAQRGLGAAYALYYLAKRAAIVAAALPVLEREAPIRVLDIGAGTNATALALAARYPGPPIEVDAVEPSTEMRATGESVARLLDLVVRGHTGTLEEVLAGDVLQGSQYDLIVMSAVLPYGWEIGGTADKVAFGDFLEHRLVPGGRLLVIEPRAKVKELAVLRSTFERTATVVETLTLIDPDAIPLPRCTGLLARWRSQPGFSTTLSPAAEELMRSAMRMGLSVNLADVALLVTRRIGPVANPDRAEPSSPPVHRRVARNRTPRLLTSVSRRRAFVSAALAVGAIAFTSLALRAVT